MARVDKRKARADIYARGLRTDNPKNKKGFSVDHSKPADDNDRVIVNKGQTYYTWTLFRSAPRISLTYPKRQELTNSGFKIATYDLEDRISDLSSLSDLEDLRGELESIAQDINDLADEQQDKLSNMPESLQNAPTGELLQNRYDSLTEWAQNIEGVDTEDPDLDEEEYENDPELGDQDNETAKAEHDKKQEEENDEKKFARIAEIAEEAQQYTYEGE